MVRGPRDQEKEEGKSFKDISRPVQIIHQNRKREGMRAEAWSLREGTTAFDAELSALVRGIELCCLQATPGATYNIFTDSQAAMLRIQDDRPGPGQQAAVRGI